MRTLGFSLLGVRLDSGEAGKHEAGRLGRRAAPSSHPSGDTGLEQKPSMAPDFCCFENRAPNRVPFLLVVETGMRTLGFSLLGVRIDSGEAGKHEAGRLGRRAAPSSHPSGDIGFELKLSMAPDFCCFENRAPNRVPFYLVVGKRAANLSMSGFRVTLRQ